ncbi:hypothetical protein ACJX0J_009819, partial [Zea mays]
YVVLAGFNLAKDKKRSLSLMITLEENLIYQIYAQPPFLDHLLEVGSNMKKDAITYLMKAVASAA